jgi:hypothetical protein
MTKIRHQGAYSQNLLKHVFTYIVKQVALIKSSLYLKTLKLNKQILQLFTIIIKVTIKAESMCKSI